VAVVDHFEDSFGHLGRGEIVLAFLAEWYLTCLNPRCHILELVDLPVPDLNQSLHYFDLGWVYKMTAMDMTENRLVVLVAAAVDIAVETAVTVLDMHHSSEAKVSQHQVLGDHH